VADPAAEHAHAADRVVGGEPSEVDRAVEPSSGQRAIERIARAVDVDGFDAIAEWICQMPRLTRCHAMPAAQQPPDQAAITADHERVHRRPLYPSPLPGALDDVFQATHVP
jgi:hypothetical protein